MARSDDVQAQLAELVRWLEKKGNKKRIAELDRYGITAREPFGVRVGDLKKQAKTIGRDHELALALWRNGRYEARMLAAMIDEADRVTLSQMNAWAADFDNWALVDTVCMHLFDRSRHAWKKAEQWSRAKPEFTKRAAFALPWALSVHDKEATDEPFLRSLSRIEGAADDDRHFVKKAVNMALRAIGKRNRTLNLAARECAARLAAREERTARWIGSHALRELESRVVQQRLGKQ